LKNSTWIAVAFIAACFIFSEIRFLDEQSSAIVLERLISLIGVIVIASVFLPEEDPHIAEIVNAKRLPQSKILIARLILAIADCVILISVSMFIMRINGCTFPFLKYLIGVFATSYFIGAIGFAVAGMSRKTVVGYFVAVLYFFINMTVLPTDSNASLFSLTDGLLLPKFYLFITGTVLFVVTVMARRWRTTVYH
jgi:hypothetical protein